MKLRHGRKTGRLAMLTAMMALGLGTAAQAADLKELAEQLVNKNDLPPCARAVPGKACVDHKGMIREGGRTVGTGQARIAIGDPGVKQGSKPPPKD